MIEHGTVTGNAIGVGFRPCGPCGEYVDHCRHYRPQVMVPTEQRMATVQREREMRYAKRSGRVS